MPSSNRRSPAAFKGILVAGMFAAGTLAAFGATWAPPPAAPTGSNASVPILQNGDQTKYGGLILNDVKPAGTAGAGTYAATGLDVLNGNVGIGLANPWSKLDVLGDINATSYLMDGVTIIRGAVQAQNYFFGRAGNSTMSGIENTGIGYSALASDTTGYDNTATGHSSLAYTTTGYGNTASGMQALFHNTTGAQNVAVGMNALFTNTSAINNTAAGYYALYANMSGGGNAAFGGSSLRSNTSGYNNTAAGYLSLNGNTAGYDNTAIGQQALYGNTTGSSNTAIGYAADVSSAALTNATAIGANARVAISNALALGGTGANAVSVGIGTASPRSSIDVWGGQIDVTGSDFNGTAVVGASGGNAFFSNNTPANGIVVGSSGTVNMPSTLTVASTVSASGYVTTSDENFKKDIQPLKDALQKVLDLRGVSFKWKDPAPGVSDGEQIGLIAQEVEKVYPELVTTDASGKKFLNYGQLVSPLIESVKELSAENDALKANQAALDARITALEARMK